MGLMATGWLTPEDYGVTCSFNKFANPSKEKYYDILTNVCYGAIIEGVERFVEEVYEERFIENKTRN